MVFGREFAEIYDDLYEALESRKRTYSEVLNFFRSAKKGRVLDIGCGTGKLDEDLHGLGYEVLGIDSSADMIAVAKKAETKGLRFEPVSFQNFSASHTFDYLIVVFNVFGYFSPSELSSFFKKAAPMLGDGGFLIFDFWKNDETFEVKPFRINFVQTRKSSYLRVVRTKLKDQKVQIRYIFFRLANPFQSFSETHTIETFSEKTMKSAAECEGFELTKETALSDINQLFILKKREI